MIGRTHLVKYALAGDDNDKVKEVRGVRQIFLYLGIAIGIDHGVGIFLTVDHFLLERGVEFFDVHRDWVCAQCTERGQMRLVRLHTDLHALEIVDRFDRAFTVCDVAHPELHPAEDDKAFVQQFLINCLANGAINDSVSRFAIFKDKRQAHRFDFRRDARHERSTYPGHAKCARAHAIDVFLSATQLHRGKYIDLQFVVRQASKLVFEHFINSNTTRMRSGKVARDLKFVLGARLQTGRC